MHIQPIHKVIPYIIRRFFGSSCFRETRFSFCIILSLLILLLAACNDAGQTAIATPEVKVNGFGTAQNHGHSLLALPGNVLMVATHYGLFRSSDNGANWQEVAAGVNQTMAGLMTTSLVDSSLNNQRMYVLTLPAVPNAKGVLGLYTSDDEGQTWQLAVATKTIGSIYFVAPGNDSPNEVYIYQLNAGPQGLKVSHDAGQHFTNTGALPFSILGLFAIPGAPGQLIAYGESGMARSSDSGNHWQVIPGTADGVAAGITTAGPHNPIYASGTDGIYASSDEGKTFKLVYTQSTFGALIAAPTQANTLYTKNGRALYRSTDGGRSWTTLPPIKGNTQTPENMAVDLHNPALFYLSLSYPMEVYGFNQDNGQWTSLTPKA